MTIGAVIQFIASLIAFLILGTIFWFLPGYLFLRKEARITNLEKLFLGLIVGFSAQISILK